MNVLVVDDQANIARVTAAAFQILGVRPFTAVNLAGARRILAKEDIDAVLLDVNLGVESGLDFLSEVKAAPHSPPVVIFTALNREEVANEAFRLGALDCLGKPFSLDDLRGLLPRLEDIRAYRRSQEELP